MIFIDEIHTVHAVVGGGSVRIASANLNGDVDTLESLRGRVVRTHLLNATAEALGSAFDEAFEACERIPGNGATATAICGDFALTVRRSLEG